VRSIIVGTLVGGTPRLGTLRTVGVGFELTSAIVVVVDELSGVLVVGAAAIFVLVIPLLVMLTPLLILAVKLPPIIVPSVEVIVVGVGLPALIDAGVVGALGGTGGPFGFVASIPYTDAPIFVTPTVLATTCSFCPGSTGAPGTCAASLSLTERVGGTFVSNGVTNQIYDLTFTNTGVIPVSTIKISIAPAVGTTVDPTNIWNLVYDNTTNLYSVSLNNALYSAGSVYTGSGFVIVGSSSVAPNVTLGATAC